MDQREQRNVRITSFCTSSFLEARPKSSFQQPVSPSAESLSYQNKQNSGMAAMQSHKTRTEQEQGYEVYDPQARGSNSPAQVVASDPEEPSVPKGEDPEEVAMHESPTVEVHTPKSLQYPSSEEVERHNLTHCRFQPWCKHCIRGRATNAPHPTRVPPEHKSQIPGIFMNRK